MTAYLVRHGRSQANAQEVFDGQRVNSPLVAEGEEEARKTAERLRPLGITKIVTSPLQRATKTAEIIGSIIGVSDIVIEPRIAEHDKGSLSGKSWAGVSDEDILQAEGAEDPAEFAARIVAGLKAHDDDKEVTLFVSHGGVASMINTISHHEDLYVHNSVKGLDNGEFMQLDIANLVRQFEGHNTKV